MSDLISRQAAIDALDGEITVTGRANAEAVRGYANLVCDRIKRLPSAQPEIIRCKDCKHFHYDMPYVIQGVPVLGHEVCDFWGDGCKTSENGYCSFAERKTDGADVNT